MKDMWKGQRRCQRPFPSLFLGLLFLLTTVSIFSPLSFSVLSSSFFLPFCYSCSYSPPPHPPPAHRHPFPPLDYFSPSKNKGDPLAWRTNNHSLVRQPDGWRGAILLLSSLSLLTRVASSYFQSKNLQVHLLINILFLLFIVIISFIVFSFLLLSSLYLRDFPAAIFRARTDE